MSRAPHRRLMSTARQPGDPQGIAALKRAVSQAIQGAGLSPAQKANAQLIAATFVYRVTDQDGLSSTITIPMSVP
jgi:hypothetical protein